MAITSQPTIEADEDEVVHLKVPSAVYETAVETLGDHRNARLTTI